MWMFILLNVLDEIDKIRARCFNWILVLLTLFVQF